MRSYRPGNRLCAPRQQDEGDHWSTGARKTRCSGTIEPIAAAVFSIFAERSASACGCCGHRGCPDDTAAPGHPAASGWALSAPARPYVWSPSPAVSGRSSGCRTPSASRSLVAQLDDRLGGAAEVIPCLLLAWAVSRLPCRSRCWW